MKTLQWFRDTWCIACSYWRWLIALSQWAEAFIRPVAQQHCLWCTHSFCSVCCCCQIIMDRLYKAVHDEIAERGKFLQALFSYAYEYKRKKFESGYCTPFVDKWAEKVSLHYIAFRKVIWFQLDWLWRLHFRAILSFWVAWKRFLSHIRLLWSCCCWLLRITDQRSLDHHKLRSSVGPVLNV